MTRSAVFCCTTLAVLVAGVAQARGDDRYVDIPLRGNFQALFNQHLLAAKLPPGMKLFAQDKKVLEMLRALQNSPGSFAQLQEIVDKQNKGQPPTAQEETLNGIKIPKADRKEGDLLQAPPVGRSVKPRPRAPLTNPVKHSDLLDDWLRDWAKEIDHTKLGDWLRSSTSFQKAFQDFKLRLDFDKSLSVTGLDKLAERFRLGDWLVPNMKNGLLDALKLDSLPKISLPELPAVNLPAVHLPGWSMPRVSLPSVGGAGGWTQLVTPLLWVLAVGVALLLLWQISRNVTARGPVLSSARPFGPWPVDPAQVSTRTQLIQAFDYLALLQLGAGVRSWNHRAIARKLGGVDRADGAVQALTLLYERARYTTGPESLALDDQEAARRYLCQLAGAS